MRKGILMILLLCAGMAMAMDIDYRVSARGGAIMPDGKVDAMVGQKGKWVLSAGAEFAVSWAPNWQALKDWNNARIGVALSYWKLNCELNGKDDMMGHAIAPYAFVEIPFYRGKHFEIGLRPGIGCSFITKTYFNTATPEQQYQELQAPGINQSVGSVFNFYFPEALYMNFPIRHGWSLGLAAGWYHMSNGSLVQPNSGYNIFTGELSLRYQPEEKEESSEVKGESLELKGGSLEVLRKHHCEIEMAWSGGARQVYYKDWQTFFCSEIQVAAYWRAHRIFRLGGGVDIFYDGAYYDRETKFGKTYLKGATQADCWRVGISIQPEFVMGKFSAGFHFGVYVYDPVKNREVSKDDEQAHSDLWDKGIMPDKGVFYSYDLLKAGSAGYPDGWLYTQIALRYRLPYHLFVHATMKAHLTKVEFVAAGIGVYL